MKRMAFFFDHDEALAASGLSEWAMSRERGEDAREVAPEPCLPAWMNRVGLPPSANANERGPICRH